MKVLLRKSEGGVLGIYERSQITPEVQNFIDEGLLIVEDAQEGDDKVLQELAKSLDSTPKKQSSATVNVLGICSRNDEIWFVRVEKKWTQSPNIVGYEQHPIRESSRALSRAMDTWMTGITAEAFNAKSVVVDRNTQAKYNYFLIAGLCANGFDIYTMSSEGIHNYCFSIEAFIERFPDKAKNYGYIESDKIEMPKEKHEYPGMKDLTKVKQIDIPLAYRIAANNGCCLVNALYKQEYNRLTLIARPEGTGRRIKNDGKS